jgi:outer membrane protein insertion porin family
MGKHAQRPLIATTGRAAAVRVAAVVGLALLLAGATGLRAQSPPQIVAIDIAGARTVGRAQVLAWSELATGQAFTEESVAAAIRRLFATQKFSAIYVYRRNVPDGIDLIINLQEFPRIRSVTFRGNSKVKEEDLREAFPVGVGQFANPAVINRQLEGIRELYQEKGYYNVDIGTQESKIDPNNLQDLVVTIQEGKKVKVASISFEGNVHLSGDDLRDPMKQGTTGFLRSGTFKKQQFEEDKDRIIAYARDHGYLDAAIEDVDLNFRENREKLDIVIHINEGQQYTVGDINWENNTVFDDVAIADLIRLQKGQVFSEGEYLETLRDLHQLYANNGYIYITVDPVREIHDRAVNVTFRFLEGEPARIRNVRVVDNVKTYDQVILRELDIFPGYIFSNEKVMRSQRDIFQLGFFEDVQPDFQPVEQTGDVDLLFRVKEKQTGQFMFGMAYSVQTSATGFIQVAETNFRGKGQNIGVTWQFGSRRRYIDLSFTEPWFMGTPTLLGGDLFDRYQYNYDDYYESRVRGFSVRLGRRIPGTRYSTVGLRYELSDTRLSNFSPAYVNFLDGLEEQLGTSDIPFERLDQVDWPRSKSSLRLTLSRNSTDNPFFPTQGSKTTYSVELAGGPLGADIQYQEHLLNHSYYERLPAGFALHLRAYLGLIHALGKSKVPDYEKYRLGGNRTFPLRGYQDLEVVPRGNPGFIGGQFFTILSTELLFSVTRSVQLLAFLDQGDTWNSFSEADFGNLRKGAGFGIRLEVPMMGTIGFDYGYGFDRVGGPGWEPHFNIGQFF